MAPKQNVPSAGMCVLCPGLITESKNLIDNSQSCVDDDGIGFNGEAVDPRVLRRVSEHHFLTLGVLLGEQTDLRDAVVLNGEHHRTSDQSCGCRCGVWMSVVPGPPGAEIQSQSRWSRRRVLLHQGRFRSARCRDRSPET